MTTKPNMAGSLSDILDELLGKDVREQFRENLVARGNTPSITEHFILQGTRPDLFYDTDRLWIVDRILEFQTFFRFLQAAVGHRSLPTGESIDQPLDMDEWFQITRPYSSWAPPPFSTEQMVPIDRITELIGSNEEPDRMQLISKELQAMKSRLWEGIMPLSSRRWQQKQLYEPGNFPKACRILSMAINVFLYLNLNVVKAALRDTFNLIDDVLRHFENALNIKRALENKRRVDVCKKWHQFVRAKYTVMVNKTHAWVMKHVEQIKSRILDQLEAHEGSRNGLRAGFDEEEWRLCDMWQDITEIASQADYVILMPMDGYNGSEEEPVHSEYDFRTQPLRIHPDIKKRNLEYHDRRGYWDLSIRAYQVAANQRDPSVSDPATDLVVDLQRQDAGQQFARAELRGEPIRYQKEPWVVMIQEREKWGFVAYRAYHSCSDAEWDEYRARFDADTSNWGSELAGVETLQERSKIHWLDANDLGIDGGDIEALKSSFESFTETDDFPSGFATDIFLVADEASVSSYLSPQPESSPPGDTGGFICAVDVNFDDATGADRPDESPGYSGTLRVLGSLLWDDFSALVATRTQHLETLWPLAMHHPSRVYVGPVMTVSGVPRST